MRRKKKYIKDAVCSWVGLMEAQFVEPFWMQIKVYTDRDTLKFMGKGTYVHVLHPCKLHIFVLTEFIFLLKHLQNGSTDNLSYELF